VKTWFDRAECRESIPRHQIQLKLGDMAQLLDTIVSDAYSPTKSKSLNESVSILSLWAFSINYQKRSTSGCRVGRRKTSITKKERTSKHTSQAFSPGDPTTSPSATGRGTTTTRARASTWSPTPTPISLSGINRRTRNLPSNANTAQDFTGARRSMDPSSNGRPPTTIKRYNAYSRSNRIPVFVVIGVGGSPKKPATMFCIPLKDAKYPEIFPSVFEKYERNPGKTFFWRDGMLK